MSDTKFEPVLTNLTNGLSRAMSATIMKSFTKNEPNAEPRSPTPRLADLLDEADHLLRQYVTLPKPDLAMLIAVWLAQTYCFDQFRYCGYLTLRSATPRCGKTTLLRVLSQLANGSPPITSLPTPATLFRSTRPVLLLDEVDKLRNADKEKYGEVLAVLNVGFEKGGVIERCDGKTHEVKQYLVYGPKALAGIEGIADTLSDRSFGIQMERTATRMPRLNLRKMDALFVQLRSGLKQWIDDHEQLLLETYDDLPDQLDCLKELDDRFQDISEPLIVLATLADAERPEGLKVLPRLLNGLSAAAGRREPSGRERQLIAFLDIAVQKLGDAEETFVRSCELVSECAVIEDLAFIETPKKLSGLLGHFDLKPDFNHAKTERGYWISKIWIETWRGRYAKGEA